MGGIICEAPSSTAYYQRSSAFATGGELCLKSLSGKSGKPGRTERRRENKT
jgi:hypothetical protein